MNRSTLIIVLIAFLAFVLGNLSGALPRASASDPVTHEDARDITRALEAIASAIERHP